MSDKSNEQISNLMDGELDANASQFLLKRMAGDIHLSEKWESYHTIKSCLQKNDQEPLVIDVSSRVCDFLLNQQQPNRQEPLINQNKVVSSWLKPLIGMGIAASVAFMSVVMLQNQKSPSLNTTLASTTIVNEKSVPQAVFQPQISANMAASSQSIVPLYLSRFPSVSAKNKNVQNYSDNAPYFYNIPVSSKVKNVTPLRAKDISD